MWNALLSLILKTLDSRKATAIVMFFVTRLLAPLGVKFGFDLAPVVQALDQMIGLLMTWLLAQGTIDAVKEYNAAPDAPVLPPPPADALGLPGDAPAPAPPVTVK
jgi:hypothetical protein